MIFQTLLNPEYITAHLQNAMVVDLIQSSPTVTPAGSTYQESHGNQQMIDESRAHYVREHSGIGSGCTLSAAKEIAELQIQEDGTVILDQHQNQGLTHSYVQYLQKPAATKLIQTNDTQVIVSNKVYFWQFFSI